MGTVHAKHNFKVEKVVGVQMYLSGINTHTYTEYIYMYRLLTTIRGWERINSMYIL